MPARSESPDGTFRLHRRVRSRALENTRDVIVWLPPGCDGRRRRHPVVYFHDGQNIFDPATAFGGNPWFAQHAALALIRADQIVPPILVGLYNTGENRLHEYTPTRGERNRWENERSRGLLRAYARFVAEEVVPFIDTRYPTLAEREHRAQAGSSLGGLAALYGALWHPRVFGAAAAMSPSVWWDQRAVVDFVAALKKKTPTRLWLDIGTAEPGWENTRVLRDVLVARGWRLGGDLRYLEVAGAGHTETAWAARIGEVLRWLWPGR